MSAQGKAYLLTGDPYLVDRKLKSLIEQAGVDQYNSVTYDIEESLFSEALMDASTIPFMEDDKAVIIKNFDFKEKEGYNVDDFTSLLNDLPVFLTLIIVPNKTLDKRSKIVKVLNSVCEVFDFKALESDKMNAAIKNFLDKRQIRIHNDAVVEIIKRTENNTQSVMNELNKLENYFEAGDTVFVDDIDMLVPRNVESDVFQLVNKVVDRDLTQAMSICYDLMRTEDPLRLLGLIVNKFREINYAKTLLSKGYTDQDLMQFFNASKGRVFYIKKNAKNVSEEYIAHQLELLSETELKVKKGLLDKKVGLEMFILNI